MLVGAEVVGAEVDGAEVVEVDGPSVVVGTDEAVGIDEVDGTDEVDGIDEVDGTDEVVGIDEVASTCPGAEVPDTIVVEMVVSSPVDTSVELPLGDDAAGAADPSSPPLPHELTTNTTAPTVLTSFRRWPVRGIREMTSFPTARSSLAARP